MIKETLDNLIKIATSDLFSEDILEARNEYNNNTGNIWTAKYTANSGDANGSVTYSIAFSDSVGNNGVAVTSGTGSVNFNKTSPTVLTVTSSTSNASYKYEDVIAVTINFSENVFAYCIGKLALNCRIGYNLLSP